MGAGAVKREILAQKRCNDTSSSEVAAKAKTAQPSVMAKPDTHNHDAGKTSNKKLANGCYDGKHEKTSDTERGRAWLKQNRGNIARAVANMYKENPGLMAKSVHSSSKIAQLIKSDPETIGAIKSAIAGSMSAIKRNALDKIKAEDLMANFDKLQSYDSTLFNPEKIFQKALKSGVSEQDVKKFYKSFIGDMSDADVDKTGDFKGVVNKLGLRGLNKQEVAQSIEQAEKVAGGDWKNYLTVDGQLKINEKNTKSKENLAEQSKSSNFSVNNKTNQEQNCQKSVIDVANKDDYENKNNFFAAAKKLTKANLLSNWLTMQNRKKAENV